MFDLSDFGTKVFDEKVMQVKLPSPIYHKWKETMDKTASLDRTTADAIAHAMKEWAIEQGCTHYCHWFQPLTGATAEKRESFFDMRDGQPILKFSGKNLIKGESDASSFPNGGLRTTFEARGYTYWDCSSPVFIRNKTLCVPTIFVGFNGENLDMKWPLLKSIDAISLEATRILKVLGNKTVTSVMPHIGLEQEYFLVNKEDFLNREDLMFTGRTLFGALPSKDQEFESHYLGVIPEKVQDFMQDVSEQLWSLGIYAKSLHNEVAPAQFELAPIFGPANIAVDQNQIIMDVLQKTALKHNMVCLLHEKPFNGVNGSGKHNNWSLITSDGENLLSPKKDSQDNSLFLLFLSAIIEAIDLHPELIRMASSNPGNDFRLGADEAPPAIVSIFLGTPIEQLLQEFINSQKACYTKNSNSAFGISSLSYLPHDNSDRNRTSPIAFTGNKFEFRMLGSSLNAAFLNTVINSIVAESLKKIADKLEAIPNMHERKQAIIEICGQIYDNHKRILFDGNGYSESWVQEAQKRGLPNIKTFVESIPCLNSDKTSDLFVSLKIYTKEELLSRSEILYENYYRQRLVECRTLIHLVNSQLIPIIAKDIQSIDNLSSFTSQSLKEKAQSFALKIDKLDSLTKQLSSILLTADKKEDVAQKGLYLLNEALPVFHNIREEYDAIEPLLSKEHITYPTYADFFFKIDY